MPALRRPPFPPLPRRLVCLASRQSVYKVDKLDNRAFSAYIGRPDSLAVLCVVGPAGGLASRERTPHMHVDYSSVACAVRRTHTTGQYAAQLARS